MSKKYNIGKIFLSYFFGLIFIWACGDSPTKSKEPAPVSNFTATPTSLIQGQAVTFTSTSTGTITSYAWNVDADEAIEATTATYEHTYTEVGTYSVTLTVTGPGGSNPKTVADMITVSTAAPTPTTATSQTVQEDGSTTISLTATDPNGQAVTFAITTDPSNGTATLSGTDITYTPNANFYGTDSFDYTASNGTYTSDPVTITITVEGEDDGNPTTNDVSATTDEDTVVTVDLDATEIDGDNYSFSIISQPSNGTLGTINGNQVEYTPNQDWNGTDTFTFEATDDRTGSRSNVATATITVNAVNDAPVANDITSQVTDENRLMQLDITLDATDVEGDALTYSVVGTNNGTVTVNGSTATYTPNQDWNGEDTFTYKANDGELDSNTATVTVTVNAVNDAPVTEDQSASTDEDTAVEITLTATDVDGDNITYTIVSDVSNGNTSLSGATVTYTPDSNWNGTDTFTFKANDGTVDSNTSTVTITVASVNDAPVVENKSVTIVQNNSFELELSANDVDSSTVTFSIKSNPENGSASITDNNITYTPNTDFVGDDSIVYIANDGVLDSNDGTITISIVNNSSPVTEDQSASTDEDTAVDITLTATDQEGDAITYSVVSDASNGTTSLSGATVTYTPTANWNGTDTFTFKANDSFTDSNVSTVTITVASVNDAPAAENAQLDLKSNQTIKFSLNDYGSDVDGDDLTRSIISSPSTGRVVINGSEIEFTAQDNMSGSESFTYKVNDGVVDSSEGTITLNIAESNFTSLNKLSLSSFDNIQEIKATSDGHFIIASDKSVQKIDSSGNQLLTYYIAAADNNDNISAIEIDENDNVVIALDQKNSTAYRFLKYDSSGNQLNDVQFNKDAGLNGYAVMPFDIIRTSDGNYVVGVAGYNWNNYLLKIDDNLNKIKEVSLGSSFGVVYNGFNDQIQFGFPDMYETSDGFVLVTDSHFIKINLELTSFLVTSQIFGYSPRVLFPLSNGDFIIGGESSGSYVLEKRDTNGNLISLVSGSLGGSSYVFDIIERSDGSILLGANVYNSTVSSRGTEELRMGTVFDLAVAEFNSDLSLNWIETINHYSMSNISPTGANETGSRTSIAIASDGTTVVVGDLLTAASLTWDSESDDNIIAVIE